MLACLDVYYRADDSAQAACIVFPDWSAKVGTWEGTTVIQNVAPYEPGQFYKRELPCLKAILDKVPQALYTSLRTILVDSYVYLSPDKAPGMGTHLYEALKYRVPVIGVAKTRFAGAPATEVLRNGSKHPLYVTSVGILESTAANLVARMYGPYRMPTLLKRVDSLSRQPR